MYNPFPLLSENILKAKIQAGKKYFVRQTYARGLQPRLKSAFLFRAYDDGEKQLAEQHFASLVNDRNAFLYDADNPEHLSKLNIAAKQPFGYKIFYAGKKGIDWEPPAKYQAKMRKFIRHKHPAWQTEPGGDKIEIGLFEEFGELFLKFSFEQEDDTIPFEEIEKF